MRSKIKYVGIVLVLVLIPLFMGQSLRLPAGVVGNREVSNVAGNEITQEKLWHLTKYTERFGLGIAGTPTAQEVILFQADRAGEIGEVSASLNDTGTSTDVDFMLKKNGSNILSAAINVLHSHADRSQQTSTFSSTTANDYVAGDVISCEVVVTASTGAQGPMLNFQRIEQGD